MAPIELSNAILQQPFEPFRIVLTDGQTYDIRHPEMLMVGLRTAIVGVLRSPGDVLFERSVKVDLLHIIRIEPLAPLSSTPQNGAV